MAVPRVAFAGQSIPAYAKTLGRAVNVGIHPRPRNLAESREVLRVLQQYGEVVSYRHLKYDPHEPTPNSVLAIYQNAKSAQSIIDASPLRFESGKAESSSSVSQLMPSTPPSAGEEGDNSPTLQDESNHAQEEFDEVNTARQRPDEAPGGGTAFTGLGGTARWGKMRSLLSTEQAATSPPSPTPPKTFTPNPTPLKASAADLPNPPSSTKQTPKSSYTPREFHLTIEQSYMNHHAYIQRQHYYGSFELNLKSLMGDDLRDRVPVAGMADCQLGNGEVPLRVRIKRRQEEDKNDWMSLGSLWEEGKREREREMERERERERERETGRKEGKKEEREGQSEMEKERDRERERGWERQREENMKRWREGEGAKVRKTQSTDRSSHGANR